jgi:hypothetical protein
MLGRSVKAARAALRTRSSPTSSEAAVLKINSKNQDRTPAITLSLMNQAPLMSACATVLYLDKHGPLGTDAMHDSVPHFSPHIISSPREMLYGARRTC